MALPIIFLIINIAFIKRIHSKDKKVGSKYLQSIISEKYYDKILEEYDINLQIKNIGNKTIEKEILINTPYLTNIYNFEFRYLGAFLYLNETGLNLISYQNKDLILLIDSEYILNDYISKDKNSIMKLTKAIILPKKTIDNIYLTTKTFYSALSIYLIEIDKEIFKQLIESYINNNKNNNINYSAKIISKKYELFLYLDLITKASVILTFIIIFHYIYRLNKFKEKFQNTIYVSLGNKLLIFGLLYIELYDFSNFNGFYKYKRSIFIKIANFLILINKSYITLRLLIFLSGVGLYIKLRKFYYRTIIYLSVLNLLIYFYINYFASPTKVVYHFYITNLFLYSQIAFFITILSIKNIIYLFKINSKIKKKIEYKKYTYAIRFKLCIYIFQSIIFIFYMYYLFFLNQYFLFKNGFCTELERTIIMESLEILLLLIFAILYLPIFGIYGFKSFITIKKLNYYKIHRRQNYQSNIPKPNRLLYPEYLNFIRINNDKPFVILMPKALFIHNKNIKDGKSIDKNVKIGVFHLDYINRNYE